MILTICDYRKLTFLDDSLKKLGFRFTLCDTEVCYLPNSLCYAYFTPLIRALLLRGSLHSHSPPYLSHGLWKDNQPERRRKRRQKSPYCMRSRQVVALNPVSYITVIQINVLDLLYFYKPLYKKKPYLTHS